MVKKRSQGNIIRILNKYLAAQNLPIRINPDGVCLGLANVRAKFAIRGMDDDYFKNLDRIANLKAGATLGSDLSQFVQDVILAFSPELFDPKKIQMSGIENLMTSGSSLKPFLSFSMVANDKNWVEIFDSIHLIRNEALTVSFPSHAISVTARNGGGYRISDPNDPDGIVDVKNSEELVKHLHSIADYLDYEGDLPLTIQAVRHPNNNSTSALFQLTDEEYYTSLNLDPIIQELLSAKSGNHRYMRFDLKELNQLKRALEESKFPEIQHLSRKLVNSIRTDFPSESELYWRYLDSNSKTKKVTGGTEHQLDSLNLALRTDDLVAFKAIITREPQALDKQRFNDMAAYNNRKILGYCIENELFKDRHRLPMIQRALINATPAIFELITKKHPSYYINTVLSMPNFVTILNNAARGGVPSIINQLLNDFEKRVFSSPIKTELAQVILTRYKGHDAIEAAIGVRGKCTLRGNECVDLMLTTLRKAGRVLSEKELLNYTQLAIKTNQPHMVNLFIKEIGRLDLDSQKRIFQSISLTKEELQQTDPCIVNAIAEKKDKLFDTKTAKIEQPTGIMTTIGIIISKFSDWIKNFFLEEDKNLNSTLEEESRVKLETSKPPSNDTIAGNRAFSARFQQQIVRPRQEDEQNSLVDEVDEDDEWENVLHDGQAP